MEVRPISIASYPSFHRGPAITGDLTPGVTSGALTSGVGSPYSLNFGTLVMPSVVPPPAENASMADRLAFTHYQLDSFPPDAELLDGLVLVTGGAGPERLEGGAEQQYHTCMSNLTSSSSTSCCLLVTILYQAPRDL